MNALKKGIQFYNKYKKKIDPHLTFLGAYLTTKFLFRLAKAMLTPFLLKQVDVVERYGKGSYALITGGANGIGKEFALDLATKGFNLILVDFNQVNLEATQQELLKIKDDLVIKTIPLDFSKGNNPDFFIKFQQEISGLDISILINNVGTYIGGFGVFEKVSSYNILNAFNINLTSTIMVTHMVINQILSRNKYQSLILNMSSASSLIPIPYFFGYGALKYAVTNFFDALALELKENKNIDILTVTPWYISTAMIRYRKGFWIISPTELVQTTWKYVGKTNKINPHWKHQLEQYIREAYPAFIQVKLEKFQYKQKAEAVSLRQN